MLKIFATFAFGVMSASAAPTLETTLPPFGAHASVALVFANGDAGTPAPTIDAARRQAASNATSSKQQRVRKASKSETDDGFCECADDRVRAHCLIYMKLRGDRS